MTGRRHPRGQKFIPFYPLIRAGNPASRPPQGQKFIPFYPLIRAGKGATHRRHRHRKNRARHEKPADGLKKRAKKFIPFLSPYHVKKHGFMG